MQLSNPRNVVIVRVSVKGLSDTRYFLTSSAERLRSCIAVKEVDATSLWEISTAELIYSIYIKLGDRRS